MRLISVGPVAYKYAERRRTTWVFCLCPPVRWSPQSPDCRGALVGGREMTDPLGRLSAKLRARASKVLSRWGALVHAIPFVLAAVVPVFVLSVLTRVLGVDLGYGAVAETLVFPIIVGAAWGGGLGAVLVSAVAIAFISPTAAHEFLGLQKSVPIVAVWVFQAILFASFAAISSVLFSWVGFRLGAEAEEVQRLGSSLKAMSGFWRALQTPSKSGTTILRGIVNVLRGTRSCWAVNSTCLRLS